MVEDYPSYLRLLLPPTFIDSFGAEGATELCETLAVNTVLTALEISIKHICDKGATALSEMLAVNTVLTALVLENNSIRDAGATEPSVCVIALRFHMSLNRIRKFSDIRFRGSQAASSGVPRARERYVHVGGPFIQTLSSCTGSFSKRMP